MNDGVFDESGLEATLPSIALPHWNATIRHFLAHSAQTPDHLAETLRLAPLFAQARAVKAMFCFSLGRRAMNAVGGECLAEAECIALDSAPNDRETVYLEAARCWSAGRLDLAADRLDALLALWPGDALAMKLVQSIRFMMGDASGMRRSLALSVGAYGPHHWAHGFHMGARSFAWGETGDLATALKLGEAAVECIPEDAWGLHAVAHVHDMRADPAAGLRWLDDHRRSWAHCNNFGTHVWWHQGLMFLEQGRHGDVLRVYDDEVRAVRTDDYRDIANATSLLARLMLEGVAVGDRWEELADLSERHADDGTVVFGDMHTMLALIGGDRREARAKLLAHMRAPAHDPVRTMDAVRADPGAALASGLEHFAEGDYAAASRDLAAAAPALSDIGGSIAQRDVFSRITIEAALRAGHRDRALGLLAERTATRGGAQDSFARSRLEALQGSDAARDAA